MLAPRLEIFKRPRRLTSFKAGRDSTLHTINSTNCLLIAITWEGLRLGLVPRYCPVCGIKVVSLVVHHWGNDRKWMEVRRGNYRRICDGCNVSLGHIFKNNYPCWEEQLERMKFERMEPFWEETPYSRITVEEVKFWEDYFGEKLPYLLS